jgi:hypothetical protein
MEITMLTFLLAAALAAAPDYCATVLGSPAGKPLVPQCRQELARAVRAHEVKVDAKQLVACDGALRAAPPSGPLVAALPDACTTVLVGTRPSGAACTSSLQCTDGLYCRGLSLGPEGVCGAAVPVGSACETVRDELSAFTRGIDHPRHRTCEGSCVKGRCLSASAKKP